MVFSYCFKVKIRSKSAPHEKSMRTIFFVNLKKYNKLRRLHKTNASINNPELASTLNNEFYSVWNSSNQPDISKFILNKPDPSTPLLFTPGIINNSLKQINSSTPGPDGLKPQLLKCIRLEIAEIVSTLFNQSLFYSFVPSQWKESNIVPIPKDNNSYRPISLTSILCKTFERTIAKYIIQITTKAGIWHNNQQFGFIPGRNTMDAIALSLIHI